MADGISALFQSTQEQVQPVPATVKGSLPNWLSGSYIKNGPGVFDIGSFSMNHWCDGFAVVYKFDIRQDQIEFSKKIVESEAYKKALAVGRPVFTEFGTKAYTDSNKNMFQKFISHVIPELTDNVVGNLYKLGNTIYLTTETNYFRILNPKTLASNQKVDLSQHVPINMVCSHCCNDTDGTYYTMGSSVSSGFKNLIIKIPPIATKSGEEFKKAQVICTIPNSSMNSSSFSHSFGLSEKWIIYIKQPLFLNNLQLITSYAKGKCMIDCMEWKPEEPNRFILIDKKTGKIFPVVYESSSPFFFFHHINTYEENNELIVDIIAHDSPEVIHKMFLNDLRQSKFDLKDKASFRRFVLPILNDMKKEPEGEILIKSDTRVRAVKEGNKIKVTGAMMTEPAYELPTLNPSYYGKKYKYFYAAGLYGESLYRNCIVKVATEDGEVRWWKESDSTFPGEALFVPRPGALLEDDGVLLSGVTDLRPGSRDFLLVLDARDLTELARAEVDAHVPNLLHGIFVKD